MAESISSSKRTVLRCLLSIFLLANTSWIRAAEGPADPFTGHFPARVLLFVRTDCPLSKRYGPELARLAEQFEPQGAGFWIVYSPREATAEAIEEFKQAYQIPGTPLPDTGQQLSARARCTVSPEAAVFDAEGELKYHGRIDDRWSAVGKARPMAQTHDLESAIANVLAHRPVVPAQTKAVGCALADVN